MCCCQIHPWKVLGVRIWEELALAGHFLAFLQEKCSAYGVGQSFPETSLAWYLTSFQVFLSFVASSSRLSSCLLLIKIHVSALENFTSCLGNVNLIIYTCPTFSSTPNLNLCFKRKHMVVIKATSVGFLQDWFIKSCYLQPDAEILSSYLREQQLKFISLKDEYWAVFIQQY